MQICAVISNKFIIEEIYLLVFNAEEPAESQVTFQRSISPPSSGSKNIPSKKAA
jgi:hypothetical protein